MERHLVHPRVYPVNYHITDRFDATHPAVCVLQVHAEACDTCVGKEIEWPGAGNRAIEQTWFSTTRMKEQSFSSFAYEFLSYDLILDGWLEMAPEPTESELGFLVDDEPLMRALLDECEEAAIGDKNTKIRPLIAKTREFLDAYCKAIQYRFDCCGIKWSA